MALLFALLLGAYELPPGDPLPAPDAAAEARILRDLSTIRSGSGEAVEAAIRDLALVGECALPAIVDRLNAAGPGERLLLLGASSRMPRAAPLLAQAREDRNAAVRAFATPLRRQPPKPDLRRLASEYLDLLAVAEHRRRADADEDLKGKQPRIAREDDTFEVLRSRMRDARLAEDYREGRLDAALRFARAGGLALVSGEWAPSLDDPVFLAYLALLREETSAFYYAVSAVCALGERVAPVLEELLQRPNHDPRRILPILLGASPGRGRALCARRETLPAGAQAALVDWSREILPPEERVPWLERAAESELGEVRAHALEQLLALPAPAGADVAALLFGASREGDADYGDAARLLARAGRIDVLAEYATLEVAPPGGESAVRISNMRRASIAALKREGGPGAEELGRKLLSSEAAASRMLGVELVRDEKLLLAAIPEAPLVAPLRLLDVYGAEAAPALVAALRECRDPLSRQVAQALRRVGAVEALVELAEGGAAQAVDALASCDEVDPRFEARLLALYDGSPDESRDAVLAALLPLGTPHVRDRVIAAGDRGIAVLSQRADIDGAIRFSIPLLPRVANAGARELRRLGEIGRSLPDVEAGLFLALLRRWETLALEPGENADPDDGAPRQRSRILENLSAAHDPASVEALFDRLVKGEVREVPLVLPLLRAAASHLDGRRLADLGPLLLALTREEAPIADRRAPPYDELRRRILWGGINAIAWKAADAGLETLLSILLDPSIQPSAYNWEDSCPAPAWALEALRHFDAATVEAALRGALARAESDGRLAAMHPETLATYASAALRGRERGRPLTEVTLVLADLLDRIPFAEPTDLDRTTALSSLGRWSDAAASARSAAARMEAMGVGEDEGFWTPRRLAGRAAIYEAVGAKDWAALRALGGEPILRYLAGWNLLFQAGDAAAAAEQAVAAARGTGGLEYAYRDLLGIVRQHEGRHADAIWWFDPQSTLPVRRPDNLGGRYLISEAKALLALGDRRGADGDLERALRDDRRIVALAKADPDFAPFAETFRQADEDFLESLFRED